MTYAVTNNPAVYAERYGSRHFTVLNDSIKSVNSDLIIDLSALNIPKAGLHVINMMTGAEIAAESRGNILSISLAFLPEESIALELR